MVSDTGHWVSRKEIDPDNHFGFVYEMTNRETGRKYIGKKQYWFKKPGKKSTKSMDSPGWNPDAWRPSDWKTYKSSSNSVKKDTCKSEFDYVILSQWRSSQELIYVEARLQWAREVLKGDQYYNNWIDRVRFPCPVKVIEDGVEYEPYD